LESILFVINKDSSTKILTREIVLDNLKAGGAWDVLEFGRLSVELLKGYTEIGEGAFKDIQKIRPNHISSIKIPNTITKISKEAFACLIWTSPNDLTTVLFEEGSQLKIIDDSAFENNSKLSNFILPVSVKKIGSRAFVSCLNLIFEFMPNSQLESIGAAAFGGNNKLPKLILLDSLKSIGNNAFYGCSGLVEIIIPINVTSIGESPFLNCLFAVIENIEISSKFKSHSDHLGLELEVWDRVIWS